MSIITDIIQGDQYKGDASLGGASAGPLTIDNSKPLATLSDYTNLYNKAKYDQGIIDRDAKIKSLSELNKINLSALHGKDVDEMTKKLDDFQQYARQYASNPNRSVAEEVQWQGRLNKLIDTYTSAKQRSLKYYALSQDFNTPGTPGVKQTTKEVTGDTGATTTTSEETVDSTQKPSRLKGATPETPDTAATTDERMKQLNANFDSTSIDTPLSDPSTYKPVINKIPQAAEVSQKIALVKIGPNDNEHVEGTIMLPRLSTAAANVLVNGLGQLYAKPGAGAGPQVKSDAALQNSVIDQDEVNHYATMREAFNAILTDKDQAGNYKYFDHGVFNATKFEHDGSIPPQIMDAYNNFKYVTQYSQEKIQQLRNGQLRDKFPGSPSSISENDFRSGITNFTTDGVSAQQLVSAAIGATYKGDVLAKTVAPTGHGIEMYNAETQRGHLALEEKKLKDAEGLTTANAAVTGNLINGVNIPVEKMTTPFKQGNKISDNIAEIKNGTALDASGNVVNFSGEFPVPKSFINNDLLVGFNKLFGDKSSEVDDIFGHKTVTTKGVSQIGTSGSIPYIFKDGHAVAIRADDQSIIRSNQTAHIGQKDAEKGVAKKNLRPDYQNLTDQGAGITPTPTGYTKFRTVNGVKYGMKADGTVVIIK